MSPFIWLGIAAVMAVVEVASLSLITMWFVVGALIAFAANLLGADVLIQVVVFLVVSVVCLIVLRPVFVRYRDRGKQEEPTCIGPVSYTHLDVYKRQSLYLTLPAQTFLTWQNAHATPFA